MLTQKLRHLLEEYQRKKWFPDRYPDPYGDLMDTLTVPAILSFAEVGDRPSLSTGYFLGRELAQVCFPELLKEVQHATSKGIGRPEIHPDSVSYFLRALDEGASRDLWKQFREWNESRRSLLERWLKAKVDLARQLKKLDEGTLKALKIDPESKNTAIGENLKNSLDFFDWQLRQHTAARNLRELLRFFRWERWDSTADWNDFRALGKSLTENCGIKNPPRLKQDRSNEAIQCLFPILPPARVQLRYGKAAGAADALRFVVELGKGCFYAGMNPELNLEDRICGDPSLPYFWGFLYALSLATTAGLNRLVGPQAESLAEPVRFWLQFRYRYDAMLAFYEWRVPASLKEAQDLYVDSFESAFPFEAPHFLYLYDLDRATDALFRTIALEGAVAATNQLAESYGRRWFSSAKFTRRARESWYEGFCLTLREVLAHFEIAVPTSYPFLSAFALAVFCGKFFA